MSKLPGTARELRRQKRLRDYKILLIRRLLQLLISYIRRIKKKEREASTANHQAEAERKKANKETKTLRL